jgi:hypothetical protein
VDDAVVAVEGRSDVEVANGLLLLLLLGRCGGSGWLSCWSHVGSMCGTARDGGRQGGIEAGREVEGGLDDLEGLAGVEGNKQRVQEV